MTAAISTAPSSIAERFDRDGFVFPLTAMSGAEAADYRAKLEAAEAQHATDPEFRKCLRRYPNLLLPFVDEVTRLPAITDAVAEILGPDLLVLDPPFFIKEPRTPHFVSWHQDLHYWGLEGEDEVTAWVALTPATVENGCMRFVAGSHRQTVEHIDTHAEQNLVRGEDRFGNFRECRPPSGVFMPKDLEHWRDMQGARDKVIYRQT